MFSKTIVHSSQFLRVPASSRLLYYDLGIAADDDGICEWYSVLKLTGATEQDLAVLQANNLVKVYDDNVLIIRDWLINNEIRKDRYTPTHYQQLFGQLKINNQKQYEIGTTAGTTAGTTNGQPEVLPLGNQMDTQDRIGKVRLGKVSNPTNVGLSKKPKSTANIEQYVEELKAKYPDKNVEAELNKASEWLNATGKVYKNYGAFYNLWLQRSDNKANGFNERKVYDVSHIK